MGGNTITTLASFNRGDFITIQQSVSSVPLGFIVRKIEGNPGDICGVQIKPATRWWRLWGSCIRFIDRTKQRASLLIK